MPLEEKNSQTDNFEDRMFEQNSIDDSFHQPFNKSSKPLAAGILLIIAGSLSILMWLSLAAIDVSIIETLIMPEFESMVIEYDSINISAESIKELFVICGTVGFFLSIFSILGGIMSIRRKMWGLALAGGILGLFTIGPIFISSILSLIAIILVAISRKEFQ